MKPSRMFAISLVALAVVVALAVPSTAQVVVKNARFTIPFQAYWEDKVLAPGSYTLTVTRTTEELEVAYRVDIKGNNAAYTILAMERPGPVAGGETVLVGEARGATVTIRGLHLPKQHVVVDFPESKHVQRATKTAENREPMPGVPIEIALK